MSQLMRRKDESADEEKMDDSADEEKMDDSADEEIAAFDEVQQQVVGAQQEPEGGMPMPRILDALILGGALIQNPAPQVPVPPEPPVPVHPEPPVQQSSTSWSVAGVVKYVVKAKYVVGFVAVVAVAVWWNW